MIEMKLFLLPLLRRSLQLRTLYNANRYSSTSEALKQVTSLQEGQKLYGFSVQKICEVPELHLAAIQLQHVNTGAKYLHIARDDKNNTFSIAFTTMPKDNTGIPHILEHLVLCGSRRFPCRDPFFKMLNRSLSTFMNAFTGSDYTMYPFSTQNTKDFRNLLEVYLDAVFFPKLDKNDFKQEGWRLEHEDIKDKNSPIVFKGVVYNEMKGVFCDSCQMFAQTLQNKLFPSLAYSYVSGGIPEDIPSLTWEMLKQFHSTYYHPSNARIFTYGNMPLESHLQLIDELALSKFSKILIDVEFKNQSKWSSPETHYISCQADPMAPNPDKQTTVSVGYLLNDIRDTRETFTLSILSNLLTDGPNSPLYQALIESGMGSDFSPSTGYDNHTKQSYFTVGLQGISKDDVEKVTNIIEKTIDDVINKGFLQERIEGILHFIELSTKHQTSNFGLQLTMTVNSTWNHGGDPIEALKVNEHVEWFKQQLKKNPRFLQDKLKYYFKENSHRLTLIMNPKDDYEKEKLSIEKELLQNKLKNLQESDKENIYSNGLELAKKQSEVEDVSVLPTLHIDEVEKTFEATHVERITLRETPVQICEQPTNGIVYFYAVANAAQLSDNLKMYLPLFCNIISKMGAGNRDYKQLDQEIELKTGGLNADVHIAESPLDFESFEQGILLSSYCLDHNVQHMFNLWTDIFNKLHLEDEERLQQLIKIYASDLIQNLASHGHLYAVRQAGSSLSESGMLKEQMSGMSQMKFMKNLAEQTNFESTLQCLREIANVLLQRNNLRCAINTTSNMTMEATRQLELFLTSVDYVPPHNSNEVKKFSPVQKNSHFIFPFFVNYFGKSFLSVPFCHKDYASLRVAANMLTFKFLHREIRERGGAYGGGCFQSPGGTFNFFSYRDPNTKKTLQAFQDSVHWLLNGDFSSEDIHEAKLRTFGDVDKPVPPGRKGLYLFLDRLSDDIRQSHRDNLFVVNGDNIRQAVSKYLSEDGLYSISLIGPENELTMGNSNWTISKE
ncbi:presequence protease, mitochondrial-like [Centruroides vittatus]|uniref:presequence protease, mitochondrial-like n=1 Tax=Centruroides vittatus TaxID=120091 RepID=UPI00351008F7